MFVTLIAVVVAIALGHLAHALVLSVRQYGWFERWMQWLDARFPEDGFWRGRYGVVLALLPPLLVVLLFQRALGGAMFGLPAIVFGIVALFYAWGPSDLDLDVEAIVEARDPVTRHTAAARLWPAGEQVSLDAASLVGAVFRNAKRRWFGVLFWFLLFGPVGALLYRLTAIAAEGRTTHQLPTQMVAGARGLLAVLDWPVAQLVTLSMALVGNFDAVFVAWRENGGASFAVDDFLAAAGRACVRIELADEDADDNESGIASSAPPATVPELPELRDAMSLVWRILLLWLAVIALFVIAGWVT